MFLYARLKSKRIMLYCCHPSVCPSISFTLSSQIVLNPRVDWYETWYTERSQFGDVHIVRGVLSDVF